MSRALELAKLGRGHVSPNPMVGCVIVHNQRIIGEGWHRQYGGPHAEVNAVRSVTDESLLPESTVYVTLEPCSHFGKTPPCADLLIAKRVKKVIVCNDDPNPLVAGKGLAKLRAAGIEVETGLLAERGRELNRRFFTFIEQQRPYLILKWAETADGFMAPADFRPIPISSPLSRQLVHKWRTEEDAIMVGTNTARHDNPQLNARLWSGRNPVRIVIDKQLQLPASLHLFDGLQPTLVYTVLPGKETGVDAPKSPKGDLDTAKSGSTKSPLGDLGALTKYVQLDPETPFLPQLIADLHRQKIQSVIVEGGAALLESFLNLGLWDEVRVFKSLKVMGEGLAAPVARGRLVATERIGDDSLMTYRPS
ncbi:bifunctional diaminohydroxyphosphoribosylaminopyrimidine deaminase/5-amino-6-(5-phosphoribosylamino)uracil reductase RibD [Larkinella humicola]|uniref:Riboflavin biosynthesis protein RibD n=1 Tax=Larkinella humicola TaxID=2607654 RepID=A0A5N1JLC4_9BACT|nr:bifunctional diaminohydroxyphosphoribosylaminopyrimidine deaminase/5-amino-6-(5-phosphoribosylamino)uracil reductase RibD [Larkinella humicola]KAA9356326.1 bifunctional diaminohydroxyphosphoribosylaminopyrimidine deaminase/5-amino-6-(5-phosphoribosylamino)uracil reductase RibD [Larkinella humicola]